MTLLATSYSARAQAPSSIAGDGFLVQVNGGAYPLASYGYYLLLPANSGNGYQTIGIYGVLNGSGTYSYTQISASTATIYINDSAGGSGIASATLIAQIQAACT